MRNAARFAPRFTLVLASLLALPARAAADDLERLMALLAQRARGHVTFAEEDHLAILDRPVKSSGELLYERPDRLEKRTLVPHPASLLLDHGSLTIQYGRRRRVLALRDYPQIAPLVESLRSTLAGDRSALAQVFQITFTGSLERWTLSLVPLDAKLRSAVQRIRIEGAQDDLHVVDILQADGDQSVMTLGAPVSP
jgi:hypothetical protein